MVSFYVESLFTNVPIEGAVQAALRKLENDSDLANRTNRTPTQIADLLNFVLRSTYFPKCLTTTVKGSRKIHKSIIKLRELVGICHCFLQLDCVFTGVILVQRIIVSLN